MHWSLLAHLGWLSSSLPIVALEAIMVPASFLLPESLTTSLLADSTLNHTEKRILGKVAETWSLYQTGKDLMYHVYRNCIFLIFRIPFMNVSYFQDYDNKYPSCQTSELPVTYVFWFLKNIDLYS